MNPQRSRRFRIGASTLLLAISAALATSPAAHAQPVNELRMALVFAGCEGADGTVVLSGAVSAVGVDKREAFSATPDGAFEFTSRFVFADGTILVGGGGRMTSFVADGASGLFRFTFAGHFRLLDGTGRYEGISGIGTFGGRAVVVPRDGCPSGAQVVQHSLGTASVSRG